ncbi:MULTISPECIES: permease-like cell division protein FtsX [unclassified Streptomyces]|uniref:Cell division protein FtsX n=1 Tax=Streptomyces johnsoniae TaxID=3075532 RepID=A0ABU2S922_9ACTN|nr:MULTISPECIES: permease-like cell division protein FtsX [unclassified Streptomyces]MDT0445482.1 permease-like cell division protein FtsX [Streptomyces sp. DSM 41886]ONK13939.1 Cell division protein FtsX [Streptomyces sp. MP131-18]
MRAHFVLSEIGVGLRRNVTMTFAVIVSVALSLALLGGSLLAREQVNSMEDYWYDRVEVSIFLCNANDAESGDPNCSRGAVTEEQKEELEAELREHNLVEEVYHETAEEAYEHYQEQQKESPIAAVVTPDQMQESLRVKLTDPTKYDVISSAFAGRDGVQSVTDQRSLLENLFNLLNGVNYAALGLMALMLVVALLLIVNTVRVSAFSRRRETGIMRLVGASSFYIQLPFILEATIAGMLGAVFACLLLVGVKYFAINNFLAERIPAIDFIGWDAVLSVLPFVLVVGALMPSIAAFFALRKYLKV